MAKYEMYLEFSSDSRYAPVSIFAIRVHEIVPLEVLDIIVTESHPHSGRYWKHFARDWTGTG